MINNKLTMLACFESDSTKYLRHYFLRCFCYMVILWSNIIDNIMANIVVVYYRSRQFLLACLAQVLSCLASNQYELSHKMVSNDARIKRTCLYLAELPSHHDLR